MKNKILLIRFILLIGPFLVFGSCNSKKSFEKTIASKDGRYWDFYKKKDITMGCCFYSNGTFYYYHYFNGEKRPFDPNLYDASGSNEIDRNLKDWHIKNDSLLIMQRDSSYIQFFNDDSIAVVSIHRKNPEWSFIRARNRK